MTRVSGSWWARLRLHEPTQDGLLRGVVALSLPSIAQSVLAFGSYQPADFSSSSSLPESAAVQEFSAPARASSAAVYATTRLRPARLAW